MATTGRWMVRWAPPGASPEVALLPRRRWICLLLVVAPVWPACDGELTGNAPDRGVTDQRLRDAGDAGPDSSWQDASPTVELGQGTSDAQPGDGSPPVDGQIADGAPSAQDSQSSADGPHPCESISPDPGGSAQKNWSTIQNCLNSHGKALLSKGSYPISAHLTVPPSAQLMGRDMTYPTLVLQPSASSNGMIKLTGGSPANAKARVAYLRLDARNVLGGRPNAAIVFPGSNSRVDHNQIYNASKPANGQRAAGVYIICGPCSGVEVDNNKIYNNFYGVIFGPKNTSAQVNVVRKNEIYDNKCDPLTFMSYGVADGNTIHENGWNCENPAASPIPGGGIYSLLNSAGAKIVNNTIVNPCGHGLDIDRCANVVIEGNDVHDPGYRWNGARPHCGGAAAAFLLDVSSSSIKNNSFQNSHRPWNAGADANNVTHASGAAKFSDLPGGSKAVVAFVLARRPSLATQVSGNAIEDNTMIANCTPAEGCVGVGYFASRGTGFGAGNSWSASTTNTYRGNNPFGSNVGSKRCGGNWYAASSTCDSASSPKPCNVDDYQHNPPAGDWARNDGCSHY